MRSMAFGLMIALTVVGCKKATSQVKAIPTTAPAVSADAAEAAARAHQEAARIRSAQELRQVGQAMLKYSAATRSTTRPHPAATQP